MSDAEQRLTRLQGDLLLALDTMAVLAVSGGLG